MVIEFDSDPGDMINFYEIIERFERGKISRIFGKGAQVYKHGNLYIFEPGKNFLGEPMSPASYTTAYEAVKSFFILTSGKVTVTIVK